MSAESLPQPKPHKVRRLVGVVLDLAAQLDRLKGLAIGLQDIEAQAMPVDDGIDLSCDRVGDITNRSRTAELRRERLDTLEVFAPPTRLSQ